jgi:hypothetical protein
VDAKKRELVGNFKNAGRMWERVPTPCLSHPWVDAAMPLSQLRPTAIRSTTAESKAVAATRGGIAAAGVGQDWQVFGVWCLAFGFRYGCILVMNRHAVGTKGWSTPKQSLAVMFG